MNKIKKLKNLKGLIAVAAYTITGMVFGFFILHPLTMITSWFEFNENSLPLDEVITIVFDRIGNSFSLNMLSMSFTYTIIGGLLGLFAGINYARLKAKKRMIELHEQNLNKSILSIINEGENSNIEFKSSLRYDYNTNRDNKTLEDVIIKTIAGFLNAKGGILIIGIDDNRCILGLENDYYLLKKPNKDGFEQKLIQLISGRLGTNISTLINIRFYLIGSKEICAVYISRSSHPVYVNEGERTVFYLRTGNLTKPLNTKDAIAYIKENKNFK